MGEIRSYRDLLVWQKSMDLVVEVYRFTDGFPNREIYGLTSQLRRAAVSIPSNIAEGHGRHGTGDFVRFLDIALGSLCEVQTQLLISERLEFCSHAAYLQLEASTCEIERMLGSLIRKLRK
jgi:four helix bundle protein